MQHSAQCNNKAATSTSVRGRPGAGTGGSWVVGIGWWALGGGQVLSGWQAELLQLYLHHPPARWAATGGAAPGAAHLQQMRRLGRRAG